MEFTVEAVAPVWVAASVSHVRGLQEVEDMGPNKGMAWSNHFTGMVKHSYVGFQFPLTAGLGVAHSIRSCFSLLNMSEVSRSSMVQVSLEMRG